MASLTVRDQIIEPDIVIFDKDGTLLDLVNTWPAIIDNLVEAMGAYTPLHEGLRARVGDVLGIDLDQRTVDGKGCLAMGTAAEADALLAYCLYREGIRWDRANAIVAELEDSVLTSTTRDALMQPTRGALPLLKTLKDRGIPTAVATNDYAADALRDMQSIGAAPYLDLVFGADSVAHPKPAPDIIHAICARLGADPSRAIMVGDTVMDALSGRNAGVLLTVGIAGVVPAEDLRDHVDVVISSLEEIR